jgi:hypothetical protein
MSRLLRQFLIISLVACYSAVALCGPCLHALPGSSHHLGAATKSGGSHDPTQSRSDTADNCLICQFVVQGQMPVAFSCELAGPVVTELTIPSLPTCRTAPIHLPSSPRAPPLIIPIGS